MRKNLVSVLIFSIMIIPAAAFGIDGNYEGFAVTPEDLSNERFYESPVSRVAPEVRTPEPEISYPFYSQGRQYKELEDGRAPLFKQIRLKLTDVFYNRQPKVKEPEFSVDEKESKTSLPQKLKFWKKHSKQEENAEPAPVLETDKGTISESIQEHTEAEIPDESGNISLETGVSEQVVQKELVLDSDNVTFDDDTGDMVATGRPVLTLPQQNTKIIADKMTYNQDSNILKAIGHVIIIRNGMPTKSDYVEVDMNEETIISDNVELKPNAMIANAKKAVQKDGLLILTDGYFHSDQSEIHRLSSRMVGPRFSNMIIAEDDKSLFLGDPSGNKLHLNIDEIYVEARKDHDVIKAKHIEVNKNGHKLFTWPSITAYTNKDRDYFEANYPEFGSRRKLGMFLGPGFTFGGPNGSVIKLIPFINYKDDVGIGGAMKYRSPFNSTELGYGSAKDIFFLKGIQRLDDNLFLQYSANSYVDDWFLGARMPKYMVEAYFDKSKTIPHFLTEGRHLTFRQRAGFGLMEDNDRNFNGEKIASTGTTTTRLRYMAEISQKIYSYKRPEDRFYFNFDIVMQGSAALYGTGDTQFIARIGPRAHIQYKNWMQDIGYFQSGYDDNTPVPRYDMYRYGHSAFYLSEIIRLNKYISVGWTGMVNLSGDSPNDRLFQENRFAVAIGPDDLKIRIGYDFIRETTYFGFDIAFDTKGTTIKYGKMEIKNPERLGKKQKDEERQIAFSPSARPQEPAEKSSVFNRSKQKKPKTPVLQYAQVINIEDPDRERVD